MSSNRLLSGIRGTGFAAICLIAATLSGCQVRPLYSEGSTVSASLGAITISEAKTRVEQEVRNNLIFMTSRGAGEPEKADYNLELNVASSAKEVLLVDSSDRAQAGQITVTGNYTFRRISDGRIIKATSRSVTTLVDFPVQEFSKLRAIRDAENKASRELAEVIQADLAGALGRSAR